MWHFRFRPGSATGLKSPASLQLNHDRASCISNEKFSMRAVASIESDFAGFAFMLSGLAVRCCRFQSGVILIDHHDVLVMEVHRRRFAEVPAVSPDGNAAVFNELHNARPGKSSR